MPSMVPLAPGPRASDNGMDGQEACIRQAITQGQEAEEARHVLDELG